MILFVIFLLLLSFVGACFLAGFIYAAVQDHRGRKG